MTHDRRGHAIRTRSRQMREIEKQPRRWRLYHVERTAFDAVTLAQEANKLLEKSEVRERIKVTGFESLLAFARMLGRHGTGKDAA